ncbi:MAG: diguanylate cyclase [Pseudomonadota bacterium]
MSPQQGQDVVTLMDRADIALYRAKAQGRNNFQFYQPI